MPRLTPLFALIASLVFLGAVPSPAQAQNYGYCYSMGKDSAGQKQVIYTGVFPWADNSAAGSASSTEARAQMRRAFRASLDEARLHPGNLDQICTTRGRQEQTIQSLQTAKKYDEEELGYKVTPFTFTPPANLAFSGPTEEATLAWLNATLPANVHLNPPHKLERERYTIAYRWFADNKRVTTEINVPFRDVRAISWTRQENGLPRVVFTGTFRTRSLVPGHTPVLPPTVNVAEIFLRREVGDADVERLVRALRHYASLRGATLASDDLFQ